MPVTDPRPYTLPGRSKGISYSPHKIAELYAALDKAKRGETMDSICERVGVSRTQGYVFKRQRKQLEPAIRAAIRLANANGPQTNPEAA